MSGEANNIEQNGLSQTESMDTQDPNAQGGGDQGDDDERKLFVGGLGWDTTQEELKEYMEKFGAVVSCALKTDIETRKSRGFGFVVFQDASTIDKVLEQTEHKIKDRKIDPKRANPRGDKEIKKKIFVGKVDPSTSEDTLRTYFEQFGKVEKVELPYDKMKDQRRNFVFIEFDSETTVTKVMSQENHKIGDDQVDIKKVTPSSNPGRGRGRGFFRGGDRGRGGRGGGWGNQGYGGGWGNQGYGQGYNQGYGGYNQGYGGYGGYQGYPSYGYDQSGYYGGWGGYDQSGYGYGYGYGNGSGYAGYDYSGWGYDQSGQQGGYGKAPKGGRGGGYRPY